MDKPTKDSTKNLNHSGTNKLKKGDFNRLCEAFNKKSGCSPETLKKLEQPLTGRWNAYMIPSKKGKKEPE